jgi:serine/threonine-protein kinase HipA
MFPYLVGNNDAHGKNFSLLYRGTGTENFEIRLAPLYDLVSTVYYPELGRDMAMRIGGEYSSEKVTSRNFEQLAEEAGLGKPLVRGRVVELSEKVVAALPTLETAHPVAQKVAALIGLRSEKAVSRFRT